MEQIDSSLSKAELDLLKIVFDKMDSLGIPKSIEQGNLVKYTESSLEFLNKLNQEEVYQKGIERMLLGCPRNEEGHSLRVALRGVAISEILELGIEGVISTFIGGIYHDIGKLNLKEYYPEKNPFKKKSRAYFQFINKFKYGHVSYENITKEMGSFISSIIEQHHRYQNGRYPKRLKFEKTPESYLLSKILAISDGIDAITSRPLREVKKRRASPEESLEIACADYGKIRLNYKGNILSKVDTNGREIISELRRRELIGRKKPLHIEEDYFRINPFIEMF